MARRPSLKPRYHATIQRARDQALSLSQSRARLLRALMEEYAEELATRAPGARNPRRAAAEVLRAMSGRIEEEVRAGVRLTASRLSEIYADATAGLGLTALAPEAGVRAAQAILARPALSSAFHTIRSQATREADRVIARNLLRGDRAAMARELRLLVVGADALPQRLLLDQRRIGYAALRDLGYEPTAANLEAVRRTARGFTDRAELIARTEVMNAESETHRQSSIDSGVVAAIDWRLSNRHKGRDICDAYAEVDWYGLGPGRFPPEYLPLRPHPRCLCPHLDVLRPASEWGSPRPPLPFLAVNLDDVASSYDLSESGRAVLEEAFGANRKPAAGAAPRKPKGPRATLAKRAALKGPLSDDPLVNKVARRLVEEGENTPSGQYGWLVRWKDTLDYQPKGTLGFKAPPEGKDWAGFHTWKDDIYINPAYRGVVTRRLARAGEQVTSDDVYQMHTIKTVVHEFNHAKSPLWRIPNGPLIYGSRSAGALIEEGIVEYDARKLVSQAAKVAGVVDPATLGIESYQPFVAAMRALEEVEPGLARQIMSATSVDEYYEPAGRALRKLMEQDFEKALDAAIAVERVEKGTSKTAIDKRVRELRHLFVSLLDERTEATWADLIPTWAETMVDIARGPEGYLNPVASVGNYFLPSGKTFGLSTIEVRLAAFEQAVKDDFRWALKK